MELSKPERYYRLFMKGWTYAEIAHEHGIEVDSVRRVVDRLRQNNPQNAPVFNEAELSQQDRGYPSKQGAQTQYFSGQAFGIPEPITEGIDEPITIESNACLVMSDWHVPGHNPTMLERACRIAARDGITDLAVIGDIYDFSAISQHQHNQHDTDTNDVIRLAGSVMRAVFAPFKRVWLCNGNHDERVAKKLDSAWDLELLINASMGKLWPECEIVVTNRDYLYLNDTWIIGHPSNYSAQGGKTPADYAEFYHRHVVTAHNHIVGLAPSKSGEYIGLDCGHMTSPQNHYYVQRRLNKFQRWIGGFVTIVNDFPTLYTDRFTDWGKELK